MGEKTTKGAYIRQINSAMDELGEAVAKKPGRAVIIIGMDEEVENCGHTIGMTGTEDSLAMAVIAAFEMKEFGPLLEESLSLVARFQAETMAKEGQMANSERDDQSEGGEV